MMMRQATGRLSTVVAPSTLRTPLPRTLIPGALLLGALLLGACASDPTEPAREAGSPAASAAAPEGPGDVDSVVIGACDETVRVDDVRVQVGAAGWDASEYPLQPPIAPPPGACIRFVGDVPLEPGDPARFGPRLWLYALPAGTDAVALCTAALRELEADRPAIMNLDLCAPTLMDTGQAGGSDQTLDHRLDVLRRDDVVVTFATSERETECTADPEEQSADDALDCITLLIGFQQYEQ